MTPDEVKRQFSVVTSELYRCSRAILACETVEQLVKARRELRTAIAMFDEVLEADEGIRYRNSEKIN